MNQGAKRHALAERGNDLYETPACAVHALMKAVDLPADIWEPCAGRGAISRELRKAGHFVVASDLVAHPGADFDIQPGVDFLMEGKAPSHLIGDMAPCQTIVTNPPFKLADAFIRHGLNLGCEVIVLLRLMAIEGANRSDLMDRHCRQIWAGIERLPMMHREGWDGSKITSAGVPFAWFVFSPIPRIGSAIELRRISWRE